MSVLKSSQSLLNDSLISGCIYGRILHTGKCNLKKESEWQSQTAQFFTIKYVLTVWSLFSHVSIEMTANGRDKAYNDAPPQLPTHFYSPHHSSLDDTPYKTFHWQRSRHWLSMFRCGRFYSSQTDCSLARTKNRLKVMYQ